MHAVFITFTSAAGLADLAGPFTEYAQALRGIDGLVSKTWINDGDTVGGFHVFTSRDAADAYLSSAMVEGLTSNPLFHGFEVRHYAVLDDLSRITGSPQVALAGSG
jgi:hypothetical protein